MDSGRSDCTVSVTNISALALHSWRDFLGPSHMPGSNTHTHTHTHTLSFPLSLTHTHSLSFFLLYSLYYLHHTAFCHFLLLQLLPVFSLNHSLSPSLSLSLFLFHAFSS